MPGVALDGSNMEESTYSNYISYDVYDYVRTSCANRDPETGACLRWNYGWRYQYSDNTNALIDGVVNSSSNVYVNGKPIVFNGCSTSESWVANPSVPSNTSSREYRNVSPGHSGSGSGEVTGGNSSNVYVNGNLVAVIGSQVTTHLGNTTTIQNGSSSVFVG